MKSCFGKTTLQASRPRISAAPFRSRAGFGRSAPPRPSVSSSATTAHISITFRSCRGGFPSQLQGHLQADGRHLDPAEGTFGRPRTPNQPFELKASSIEVEGQCTAITRSRKNGTPLNICGTIAHLRPAPKRFSAVLPAPVDRRVPPCTSSFRSGISYTSTLPSSPAATARARAKMFRVSTLDPDRRPATIRAGSIFSKDFFGKEPNLTVSGQLEAETYCMAFRNV